MGNCCETRKGTGRQCCVRCRGGDAGVPLVQGLLRNNLQKYKNTYSMLLMASLFMNTTNASTLTRVFVGLHTLRINNKRQSGAMRSASFALFLARSIVLSTDFMGHDSHENVNLCAPQRLSLAAQVPKRVPLLERQASIALGIICGVVALTAKRGEIEPLRIINMTRCAAAQH